MSQTDTLPELLKTTEECIALLDSEVHEAVRDSLKLFKSKGVLIFENHDLHHKYIGQRFAIGYGGAENTLQEVTDVRCPVTPPSGHAWQYYLIAFSKEDQK